MSNPELEKMVLQTLEANGILSKVKAEIRASVYTAIDSQEKQVKNKPENQKVMNLHRTQEGKECLELVQEFLNFLGLQYTKSVFNSECNLKDNLDRREFGRRMKLDKKMDTKKPLIMTLINEYYKNQGVSRNATYKNDQENIYVKEPQKVEPVKAQKANQKQQFNQQTELLKNIPTLKGGKNALPTMGQPQKNQKSNAGNPYDYDLSLGDEEDEDDNPMSKQLPQQGKQFGKGTMGMIGNQINPGISQQKQLPLNKQSNLNQNKFGQQQQQQPQSKQESLSRLNNFNKIQNNNQQRKFSDDMEEEIDESLDEQSGYVNIQNAQQFASSEDYGSMSQGFDQSVDSLELENYDYFEPIQD